MIGFNPRQGAVPKLASSAPALDQFNFVSFGRVDKGDRTAVAMRMRAIGERITFGRSLFCEFCQIVHLERKMGKIGSNHNRAAFVVLAKLDFLFASRRFEEYQLRAAPGSVPPRFLQSQNVLIKGNRLFQIGYPITGMQ